MVERKKAKTNVQDSKVEFQIDLLIKVINGALAKGEQAHIASLHST